MTDANVHVFATGGTIANPPSRDGYIEGDELSDSIDELSEFRNLSVTDVSSLASSAISPDVWYDLHEEITAVLDGPSPPDGVVVTHGSNTVEETAYFLNLTLDTDVPVVLTAAQRNHGTVGYDGGRNLVDSIRTAAHPDAAGRGAMVVVNDEIHHAREVTKTVSGRPDAWNSGDFGPIGLADKYGLVRFYRRTDRRHTANSAFASAETTSLPASGPAFPDVQVVYATAGGDGTLVDAAVEAGADGIVVAAFPTGSPARSEGIRSQADAMQEAAERGVPVVVTHRGTEGWPRSGLIEETDFVWGDTLTPQKARILLGLALGQTTAVDEIQEFFLTH